MTKHRERFLLQALPYESQLRAYLRRSTRNRADADELLQETYARLLGAGDTDTVVVHSIRTFAFTIAHRLAIDLARARRTQDPPALSLDFMTDVEQQDAQASAADVADTIDAQQELQLLAAALAGAPKRSREVFTLRKIYGYSQAEIAQLLGIKKHTVERHVGIAARRCADYLCNRRGAPARYSLLEPFRRLGRRVANRRRVVNQ